MFRKIIKLLVLLSITLGIFININNTIVYADGDDNYVCFELVDVSTPSTITMVFVKKNTDPDVDDVGSLKGYTNYHYEIPKLEYSYDKNNWNPFTMEKGNIDNTVTLDSTNPKVYFRARCSRTDNFRKYILTREDIEGTNETGGLILDYQHFNFKIDTGSVKLSGDSRYLFDKNGNIKDVYGNEFLPHYAMDGLFMNCTGLVDASEFLLPATLKNEHSFQPADVFCLDPPTSPDDEKADKPIYADGQYMSMFEGCTNLKSIPKLPANLLTEQCYYRMFYNCTSLTAADLPDLNIYSIETQSLESMFQYCSGITLSFVGNALSQPEEPGSNSLYTKLYTIPSNDNHHLLYHAGDIGNMFGNCNAVGGSLSSLPHELQGNARLYFYYAPELKITYDGNDATGGTPPVDNDVYQPQDNDAEAMGKGSLTKDGYEFVGWNTKADGSGKNYAVGATIATDKEKNILYDEDLTLYAKWEPVVYTLPNYEYILGSDDPLVITCYGYNNFDNFESAYINNDLLIEKGTSQNDKCKLERGSTIITVDSTYLNDNYPVGTYNIIFHYTGISNPLQSTLRVIDPTVPPSPPSPPPHNPGYSIPNTGIE